MEVIGKEIRSIVSLPENIVPFLTPGRLIRVQVQSTDPKLPSQEWGWGVLVNFTQQRLQPKNLAQISKRNRELQQIIEQNEQHYVLDLYLYIKDRLTSDNMCQPGTPSLKDGRLGIMPVVLHPSTIHSISSITMKLPHNFKQVEKTVEEIYFEMMRRFSGQPPLLHPVRDMEIEDKTLGKLLEAQESVTKQLQEDSLASLDEQQTGMFARKQELKDEIRELEESIKKASAMIMSTELVSMRRVMRRLDLADKNDVPTLKGKVACSISACDEILVTEMLFSGMFQDLDAKTVAAVLSCLIYTDSKENQEGVQKISKHEKLGAPFVLLQKHAERVATVMTECKIPLDKEEYVAKFKPDLMELTLLWCGGASFKEVSEEARDIFEGTIIRAFRRLDELIS